jgi:hypothetical protein
MMTTPTPLDQIASEVASRPWRAVAVAFAVGAALALESPRLPPAGIRRRLVTSVGGVVIGFAREVALQRALAYARSWVGEVARVDAPGVS